jgi:hypothetical protein
MWIILILFSIFWVADFRLKQYTWAQSLGLLAVPLLVLVPLALFTPGVVWKTVLMVYMTYPLWLLPLAATRQPVAPAESRLRDFGPAEDVWPGLPRIVDEAAAGLEAEGLARTGTYREDLANGVVTLTAMFESPDGAEMVTVNGSTHLVSGGTESERRYNQVNTIVTTVFADGRRLAVGNTALMPPPPRGTTAERLASVDDSVRLVRIARAYRARWFAGARPVPVRGDAPPLEFWAQRHRSLQEHQVAGKLYRRGGDGAVYVTPLGALVLSWGMLLPFRHISELRRRLRERRVLRELGMETAHRAPDSRPRLMNPFDLHNAAAILLAVVLLLLD